MTFSGGPAQGNGTPRDAAPQPDTVKRDVAVLMISRNAGCACRNAEPGGGALRLHLP